MEDVKILQILCKKLEILQIIEINYNNGNKIVNEQCLSIIFNKHDTTQMVFWIYHDCTLKKIIMFNLPL